MKGGITSGVVYPTAGVELAARYTLKSIGGTSAGAIAAGFFAAAERRRSIGGTAKGFEDLRGYPNKFSEMIDGKTPFLQALFRRCRRRDGCSICWSRFREGQRKKPWKLLDGPHALPARLPGLAAGVLLVVLGCNPRAPRFGSPRSSSGPRGPRRLRGSPRRSSHGI
jgi:hypothetical protein